jgi:hypothetical protein
MIQKLAIQNFKSIKSLQLDCKRVNLFVGEPNVGKSNILEALSLQAIQQTLRIDGLVRVNDLSNLFLENDPSNKIVVETDSLRTEISYEQGQVILKFFKDGGLEREFKGSFDSRSFSAQGSSWDYGIHPYSFKVLNNFPEMRNDFLSIPHGENMFLMLQTNKQLRNLVSELIQERGFKLSLRQAKFEIEISKEEDSILTTYPYTVISDTLQRIIFYIAAIETNKDSTSLIFEEPESNVFPYYTKYLAEKISSDTKQYFLTTHNPYFLQSLIQKTKLDELQVNIVHMENYSTLIRTISSVNEIEELIDLDSSVFLNLDKFLTK